MRRPHAVQTIGSALPAAIMAAGLGIAALGLALATLGLALAAAPGVRAQDLPRLAGPVTDLAGVVSGDEDEIEAAIDALRREHQAQLWVLYVDTTGSDSATGYAEEVAADNGLGVGDALYLVAVEDRAYALWLSDSLASQVSVEAQDQILLDAEQDLIDEDYAGAAIAVADGIGDTLAGGPAATPAPTGGGGGGSGGGGSEGEGGGSLLPVIAAALVISVCLGGLFLVVDRRTKTRSRERRAILGTEANGLLLATDEAVKNAELEIGFVEAMYSQAEVAPYAAAIEQARGDLNAAFELRQKLDDAIPEDAATEERMLREIIERGKKAQASLATQQERIREMRELEREAPKLLDGLAAQVTTLEQRLPAAAAARSSLEAYAPSNWEPVGGNRTEAEKRIAFAKEEVADGQAALAVADTQQAAVAVRAATQAVTEAGALLGALEQAVRDLAAARDQVPTEIREAEVDIASARAAAAGGAITDAPARIAQAESTLAEAKRLTVAAPPDILGALEKANAAEAIADGLLAGIREAEEARARQAAMLEGAIASAQARVQLAAGYVTTRRHGIGDTARVRAAEAERHLQQAFALRPTDPATALAEARRAEELANEAYRLASGDFGEWDRRPPMPPGSAGADIAGAIIGGIIGGMLAGGRGPGPGWGGTPWGGGGGGRGGPPIPRIPMPGGGGGRARGGRW